MPIFLAPGYQVKIRELKNKATHEATKATVATETTNKTANVTAEANIEATILEVRTLKTLLVSLCWPGLNPGDKIELEIPQRGRGVCVSQALVMESGENSRYILKLIGKPQLLQRRRSRRITVHHKAEYVLLRTKKISRDFHEGLLLNISRDGALLASKEPLAINNELFLIFEVNLDTLPEDKVIPTGIGGKVVRKNDTLVRNAEKWGYSYGVAFDKPFVALNG